jgi:hypothetical protein
VTQANLWTRNAGQIPVLPNQPASTNAVSRPVASSAVDSVRFAAKTASAPAIKPDLMALSPLQRNFLDKLNGILAP